MTTLEKQCKAYLEFCKRYFYNPNEAKSLKAFIKLKGAKQ